MVDRNLNMKHKLGVIFFILTFLIIFFIGGGDNIHTSKSTSDLKIIEMNDDIKPIFDEWLMECDTNNLKPNLNTLSYLVFVDTLQKNYAGLYVYGEGILIQESLRDHPGLKIVVYHELGHACFNLPHDTTNMGIMSPFFSGIFSEIYIKRWDYYKKHYFDYCREFNK
jgi:hypothetical protein